MKYIPFILLILSGFRLSAQTGYTDSLYAYQANYKKDLYSVIKKDTAFVRFYAPDAHYRITAQVELLPNQPFFAMRTSNGRSHQARKFAKVVFTIGSTSYQLYAYQLGFLLDQGKQDDFFIPFIDEGSGEATYAGGRYLDFTTADIVNNQLLIDFNKAYNPYCAFTSGYSCPVPPKENTLPIAIQAGEKQFAKDH